MNIWVIGKNSIKRHYLKKKILRSPKHGTYSDADYMHTKRVCKDLEIKD